MGVRLVHSIWEAILDVTQMVICVNASITVGPAISLGLEHNVTDAVQYVACKRLMKMHCTSRLAYVSDLPRRGLDDEVGAKIRHVYSMAMVCTKPSARLEIRPDHVHMLGLAGLKAGIWKLHVSVLVLLTRSRPE
eukprot:scaffold6523_cov18-Tisochrysis_lutea.AAC.1